MLVYPFTLVDNLIQLFRNKSIETRNNSPLKNAHSLLLYNYSKISFGKGSVLMNFPPSTFYKIPSFKPRLHCFPNYLQQRLPLIKHPFFDPCSLSKIPIIFPFFHCFEQTFQALPCRTCLHLTYLLGIYSNHKIPLPGPKPLTYFVLNITHSRIPFYRTLFFPNIGCRNLQLLAFRLAVPISQILIP